MATYEKLYTPEGKMFEVRPHLVADLLLNKGWTRNKPIFVDVDIPKVEKKSKPKRKRPAPKFTEPETESST